MQELSEPEDTSEPENQVESEINESNTESEIESRLYSRLLELKKEMEPDSRENPAAHTDSPFKRMLYSIPIFGLFWLFYWYSFVNK